MILLNWRTEEFPRDVYRRRRNTSPSERKTQTNRKEEKKEELQKKKMLESIVGIRRQAVRWISLETDSREKKKRSASAVVAT